MPGESRAWPGPGDVEISTSRDHMCAQREPRTQASQAQGQDPHHWLGGGQQSLFGGQEEVTDKDVEAKVW